MVWRDAVASYLNVRTTVQTITTNIGAIKIPVL